MQGDGGIAAFSERQVERLTSLGKGRLRYWDRTGFFMPSYLKLGQESRGKPIRIYSFRDIVALRTLELLRNRNRVSLQTLRKVAEQLSAEGFKTWAEIRLWVMNRQVIFQAPGTAKPREVLSGQYVMEIPLIQIIDDAEAAIVEMRRRKGDEIGSVQSKRDIAGGPVLAGTRIRVASVQRLHEDGYSHEQIRAEYPDLTEADVLAALSYKNAA